MAYLISWALHAPESPTAKAKVGSVKEGWAMNHRQRFFSVVGTGITSQGDSKTQAVGSPAADPVGLG